MRKFLACLATLFVCSQGQSQTFTGSSGNIGNTGNPTPFTQVVSGLSAAQLDANLGLIEVCVDITHPDMNEVSVSLLSPSGVHVELINSTSIKGGNFTSTCFNSQAPSPLTSLSAPYTGTVRPTGYIGRFNNGKSGNGNWTLYVKDYNPNANSGTLNSWSLRFGPGAPAAVTFTSSNLPIVIINTNGQALSTNTILADFGIVDNAINRSGINDPKNGFNGKALLNIRGSSSKIFEKKSIKIDLCNNNGTIPVEASLLGMPAESDWILTPGYSDKTLMRNALSQYLFRNMAHYSPRTRFVEVLLNGEYYGVYTLIEKPKKADDRIDIQKMTPLDNNFPFITGGYIIQINRSDDPGWWSEYPGVYITAPAKFYYQYEYPKATEITDPQKKYIEAVMDTFETVMNGPDFADPQKGYRKYIDLDSYVDLFILNEFSKNIDGYNLSTYLYKDNIMDGGKLHIGPVWDYDIAWHNANYGASDMDMWWHYEQGTDYYPIPSWWINFMKDPYFKDRLFCRWHSFRKGLLSNASIHAWIDQQAALLSEAQARNFTQFPILDSYIFPNPPQQIGPSYQGMVDDLKNWITKRSAFMDQYIPGACNNVSVEDLASENARFTSFPNPFENSFTLRFSLDHESLVDIELMDLLGRKVLSEPTTKLSGGQHEKTINTQSLADGTYLLTLNVNGITIHHKVLKGQIR